MTVGFLAVAGHVQPFALGIFLHPQTDQQVHQLVGHGRDQAVQTTVTPTPMTLP